MKYKRNAKRQSRVSSIQFVFAQIVKSAYFSLMSPRILLTTQFGTLVIMSGDDKSVRFEDRLLEETTSIILINLNTSTITLQQRHLTWRLTSESRQRSDVFWNVGRPDLFWNQILNKSERYLCILRSIWSIFRQRLRSREKMRVEQTLRDKKKREN